MEVSDLQAAEIRHLSAEGRFVRFDGSDTLDAKRRSEGYWAVNPYTGRLERLRLHAIRVFVDGQEIGAPVSVSSGRVEALKPSEKRTAGGHPVYEVDRVSEQPITELHFGSVTLLYPWREGEEVARHIEAMGEHTAALKREGA